jgi:hypothetical protein
MVNLGMVSPDWKPMVALLSDILDRLWEDLADHDPVWLGVNAGQRGTGGLVLLAEVGDGSAFVNGQVERLGGPVPDAVVAGRPVVSSDVWTDRRWPVLTLAAMVAAEPEPAATWERVRGVVVVPAVRDGDRVVTVTCCLAEPADERTLRVVERYEPVVASALAMVRAVTVEGTDQVLGMLRTRAVIEQAKGAIMAVTRCDADTAWHKLRTVSQNTNTKLRELAIGLVEHVGHGPAEVPLRQPAVIVDEKARHTAGEVWALLTGESDTPSAAAS